MIGFSKEKMKKKKKRERERGKEREGGQAHAREKRARRRREGRKEGGKKEVRKEGRKKNGEKEREKKKTSMEIPYSWLRRKVKSLELKGSKKYYASKTSSKEDHFRKNYLFCTLTVSLLASTQTNTFFTSEVIL